MPGSENRLREAPNWAYRMMVWSMDLMDVLRISSPATHLMKSPIKSGMTVVDWGCGPGRYSIPAAKVVGASGKVIAVDVQGQAIRIVRDKAAKASLTNVDALQIDSYPTPIPTASADLVLLLDAFHGVGDRPALLAEIRRVLKPGGYLFMDPGHMELSAAREIVERTGFFGMVKSEGRDMLLAPKPSSGDGYPREAA